MTVIVTRHIEEHPGAGRLGRQVEHDVRSRSYALPEGTGGAYASVTHRINAPVLDQGSVGACTGFATEACTSGDPFYAAIPTAVKGRPTADAAADNQQALALYATATQLDNITGTYPPNDTGSTGLAAAKAAQKAGLISGYQHAFSLDAALKALATVPVITGVNWYESFDHPDATGRVTLSGSVRGGHEFCVYGIDAPNRLVWARNSWGPNYGAAGCFSFSWDDWGRLLAEQGDVTVFTPLTAPAPTPTPPAPPAVLTAQELAADLRTLLTSKGL